MAGHIITESIVVNYLAQDKDDSIHFVTHVDPNARELGKIVSPSAKRVYTSKFNAWYLITYLGGHPDVFVGMNSEESYKVEFNGQKFLFTFIDSHFNTGSVMIVLYGEFGTIFYTGYVSYYPGILSSPVLRSIRNNKTLTKLFLDTTYYEQVTGFQNVLEVTEKIINLVRNILPKKIYIYCEYWGLEKVLIDLAESVNEMIMIDERTMAIMKNLNMDHLFTCDNRRASHIFVKSSLGTKRHYSKTEEYETIVLVHVTAPSPTFKSYICAKNVHTFQFYSHPTHEDCCAIINSFMPEVIIPIGKNICNKNIIYSVTTEIKSRGNIIRDKDNTIRKNVSMVKLPTVRQSQNYGEVTFKNKYVTLNIENATVASDQRNLKIRKVDEINQSIIKQSEITNKNSSLETVRMNTVTSLKQMGNEYKKTKLPENDNKISASSKSEEKKCSDLYTSTHKFTSLSDKLNISGGESNMQSTSPMFILKNITGVENSWSNSMSSNVETVCLQSQSGSKELNLLPVADSNGNKSNVICCTKTLENNKQEKINKISRKNVIHLNNGTFIVLKKNLKNKLLISSTKPSETANVSNSNLVLKSLPEVRSRVQQCGMFKNTCLVPPSDVNMNTPLRAKLPTQVLMNNPVLLPLDTQESKLSGENLLKIDDIEGSDCRVNVKLQVNKSDDSTSCSYKKNLQSSTDSVIQKYGSPVEAHDSVTKTSQTADIPLKNVSKNNNSVTKNNLCADNFSVVYKTKKKKIQRFPRNFE